MTLGLDVCNFTRGLDEFTQTGKRWISYEGCEEGSNVFGQPVLCPNVSWTGMRKDQRALGSL